MKTDGPQCAWMHTHTQCCKHLAAHHYPRTPTPAYDFNLRIVALSSHPLSPAGHHPWAITCGPSPLFTCIPADTYSYPTTYILIK